ncbi:hypothetical protein Tcan_13172 [Toxocara canis]|uniref:Uncharacterized protein n=1 Tax=Toxocara canis TaxID=6265 RepID=A0A0B2VYG6_TOXCA|nr:hypothetical protein Tcan_13172 [Toxocara canis]
MSCCIHQDNLKSFILYLFWGLLYSTLAFVTDFRFTYFNESQQKGPFWCLGRVQHSGLFRPKALTYAKMNKVAAWL